VPFSQSYVEDTFVRYPLIARMLVELFEARFDPAAAGADALAGAQRLAAQLRTLVGGDDAIRAVLQPVVAARALDRDARAEAVRRALRALLDNVSSLDEDRILRSFMGVIDATLRTSYFQRAGDGSWKETIAFKFDPANVPELPKPRPYREIIVYGPRY